MRIAQVAPLAEAVPPKLYGGTERVVSWLTEELVAQGHDVTLFASADSLTRAELVPGCEKALRLSGIRDHLASHLVLMHKVRQLAPHFDIIHFHVDLIQYPLFADIAAKTVTTLHGRLDIHDSMPAYRAFSNMPLVSISKNQREPMPAGVRWLANIPHGLPESSMSLGDGSGGYLAFLGRISPEKRPDRAIEIARKSGIPIKIAAKVDNADREYFEQRIAPMLDDPLVDYIGEISESQKQAFLGQARALLFPIDWPEPFGLVMIEAMSTGTPVIAWAHGSVPEVIEHGKTGFIVDDIASAVACAGKLDSLSRASIRAVFEKRFTVRAMAQNYEAAYRTLLSGTPVKKNPAYANGTSLPIDL